jgi:hypothetical protein
MKKFLHFTQAILIFLLTYPLLHPHPKLVNNSKNIIIKNKISLSHPKKLLLLLLLQHPLSSTGAENVLL